MAENSDDDSAIGRDIATGNDGKVPQEGGSPTTPKHTVPSTVRTGATDPTMYKTPGKRPKKFVKLTSKHCRKLTYEVQINLVKHIMAAKHFETRQFWFFSLPQALLTTIASILAFVGGAEAVAEDTASGQKGLSFGITKIVGTLSAVAVLFQTVSGFKFYDKRADRHRTTAVQLRDLRDELSILGMKLIAREEEIEEQKKSMDEVSIKEIEAEERESQEDEFSESFDVIQKKFSQCLSGCSSYAPLALGECFHGLKSNIEMSITKRNMEQLQDLYNGFDQIMLTSKAIDILAGNIMEHPYFPMYLPDPKDMVRKTTTELKKRLFQLPTKLKDAMDGKIEEEPGIFETIRKRVSINTKEQNSRVYDHELP